MPKLNLSVVCWRWCWQCKKNVGGFTKISDAVHFKYTHEWERKKASRRRQPHKAHPHQGEETPNPSVFFSIAALRCCVWQQKCLLMFRFSLAHFVGRNLVIVSFLLVSFFICWSVAIVLQFCFIWIFIAAPNVNCVQ